MKVSGIIVQALLITSFRGAGIFALELEEIVVELNNIYDFETIVYFSNDIKGAELAEALLGRRSPLENIPKFIWNQDVKTKTMFNTKVLNIAFVSHSNRENILEVVNTALEDNLLAKVIFYFLPEVSHNINLRNFSQCLWEKRILYSLMVADNRVFTYNPYPEVNLVEITSAESLKSVFTGKLTDFHGAAVRVARSLDISKEVQYVDRNGDVQFGGYFMKTILTFIRKHNGTFVEQKVKKDLSDVGKMFESRKIDFLSMTMTMAKKSVKPSYPLSSIAPCILVPYQKELPRVYYLMLPFQVSGWILFGAGALLLFLVIAVADLLRKGKSTPVYQEAAFRVWRIVTQQIHFPAEVVTNHWLMHILILATLHFMLFTSLYQSGLSSFYTKSISAKQIDTPEDLARTSYRILTPRLQQHYFGEFKLFPKIVLDRLMIDDSLVKANLKQMDPNFGYVPPSEFKDTLRELERRPSTKLFHLTKMCTPKMLLSVLHQNESPFKDIFDDVVFRLIDAGLMMKWERDTVYELKQVGFLRTQLVTESLLRPLKFEELYFVWVIYLIGVVLSAIVFCVEKIRRVEFGAN
ncbi:unnamed protein product [Hermetia illucens]|uniref:Ionotropic receptor n=1 Tax=Hermetia illucens TaxID=343691 RepID=A0A7R8UW29_HERIL|nr:uncharacterized protein LOC119656319 [Hermetia illucens]CAD7086963.1 unnamed protein product [Hermetia illucens]